MPSGDRTGPEGYGPRTGRGLGYCNGYNSPGYTKGTPRGGRGLGRGFGRGFRRGFGRGFGWGRGREYYSYPAEPYYPDRYTNYPTDAYPPMNKEDEKQYLENLIKGLENEIKTIKNRLLELGKNNEKTP